LLLALGDALWGAGDLSRMRQTYQRAADVARGMAAQEGAPRLARAALGFGGRQQRAHLVFDVEVVRLLEEARDALGESDSPLRARILARLAYALYTRPGSHARRAQLSREAVDMARRIGDPGTLRRVLNDTRWALWGPDTIDERLSIAAELVRLADEVGDMEMALGEHAWRMVDLLELGDIAAFDAELDSYTRIARELRRPWFESYIGRFGALRALLQGRFADAERLSEGAAAAMERSPQEDATLIQGTQLLATGPLLDATARAALKTRLQELREELAEAEDANDLGRAERHREEIDQLAEHLAAATGLGGRDRGAGAQANRARVAVAKAIRVSLARIAEQSSDLAQHLDRAIKTGMFCCYVPDPLRPVAWELD
jgi:hypothetical protein